MTILLLLAVQLVLLASVVSIFRKTWLDNALLLKGFSVRIRRGFRQRFKLTGRGCVSAVAEWVSRQEYGRDVWRVTLSYKGLQRVITTRTLAFYYGRDRRTGRSRLDKDDLIRNINAAVTDWGHGSRWKFRCLDDDIPEEEPYDHEPVKKYDVMSAG